MKMSLDEFLSLDETDGKWELDDGVLYIMPSGTSDHQFLHRQFSRYLDDYLDSFEQPPAQFYQEMTTILSRELRRAPEPDIVIVLEGRPGVLEGRWVEGAPDIAVRSPVHRPQPRPGAQAADIRRGRRAGILAH